MELKVTNPGCSSWNEGSLIGSRLGNGVVNSSPLDCARHCSRKPECAFWELKSTTDNCWFFKEDAKNIRNIHFIWGPVCTVPGALFNPSLLFPPFNLWKHISLPDQVGCQESTGQNYMGTGSATIGGRPCLTWPRRYHEKLCLGDHNYCRNPENYGNQVFCLIQINPTARYDYCKVPKCSGNDAINFTRINQQHLRRRLMT